MHTTGRTDGSTVAIPERHVPIMAECDVLVCADDPQARASAIALIEDLGLRGLDAGKLVNAIALESLTPVLIHMNKHYKSAGTGLRITGIPERR